MSWTEVRGFETIYHQGERPHLRAKILNVVKDEVEEIDITELARKILYSCHLELNQSIGQATGCLRGCFIGLDEFEKRILEIIHAHNKKEVVNKRRAMETHVKIANEGLDALAEELGVEPPKFDHLEWNKLALEESRKERELRTSGPTEVDSQRCDEHAECYGIPHRPPDHK